MKKPNGVELRYKHEQYSHDLDLCSDLSAITPLVACFGGSAIRKPAPYLDDAKVLAKRLAEAGISIITGGGSGIMDASNTGAYMVNPSRSYGLRVKTIRDEIDANSQSIDVARLRDYDTLSIRLLALISYSDAIVFFPGGFGTLEEMFSLLVRIRVGMMKRIPIYFYGERFWTGLKQWMMTEVLDIGAINKEDLELFRIEDNVDEIAQRIIDELC